MIVYKFLQTTLSGPAISGNTFNPLLTPALNYSTSLDKNKGSHFIVIQLDIDFTPPGAEFTLTARVKSFFTVLDPQNVVVDDVFKMYGKATDDAQSLINKKVPGNKTPFMAPSPDLASVVDQIQDFVGKVQSIT